jgi:hypothetical protein
MRTQNDVLSMKKIGVIACLAACDGALRAGCKAFSAGGTGSYKLALVLHWLNPDFPLKDRVKWLITGAMRFAY